MFWNSRNLSKITDAILEAQRITQLWTKEQREDFQCENYNPSKSALELRMHFSRWRLNLFGKFKSAEYIWPPDSGTKMKLILVSLFLLASKVNSDPHEKVLKWWESISVSIPLKCKLNPDLNQDFHPIAHNFLNDGMRKKLIQTRLCSPDEARNYKLKGR